MDLFSLFVFLMSVWTSRLAQSLEDVRQPPSIVRSPKNYVIYRSGQEIILPCSASGTPKPVYEWLRNDVQLNLNLPNIQRRGEGDIVISSASQLDEGHYQCVASNQYGKAISNGTLLQRAYQALPSGNTVMEKVVQEGQPFHIQFIPLKSLPKAQYRWAVAEDMVSRDSAQKDLDRSKRMQWAENGDLHFAYALLTDSLEGRIYKGLTFNPYVDISSGGSYTRVKVQPVSGGVKGFPPRLAFSSPQPSVGLEGENITLHCFFYGHPEASIKWIGPNSALPLSRLLISNFETELKISNLKQSDAGTYTCSALNTHGQTSHKIELVVEAIPVFNKSSDSPQNVNVTEGESVTFSCRPHAKPAAKIKWMINGATLSTQMLPRVSISADGGNLTVRSVCRDCHDREFYSDLMVIQCNASNRHGYAFGAGYLNVLKKTAVTLTGESKVVIDGDNRESVQFLCLGFSDPSTAVQVTWYKEVDKEKFKVIANPPVVVIENGLLTITARYNRSDWPKHAGRYWCVADNGYSRAEALTEIEVTAVEPPIEPSTGSILDYWWIFLIIVCLLLILILILICCICLLRNRGDKYDVDDKERRNGNDPERELADSGFHDYQRREVEPFKGSQNSLGSSARLFGDEDASEVGEQSKFLENGSFHSVSYTNTVDRKRGRNEII